MGTVAFGDTIYNTLDTTIDATVETLTMAAGSSAQSVSFKVDPVNNDGKSGCNIAGTGSTITFDVVSSTPSVATVGSTVTFNSCGDTPAVLVTPVAAGTSTITLTEHSRTNVSGTFNTGPATFAVTVTAACDPVPAAAPTIAETNSPASSGWYNAASPAAAFTVAPATNAQYRINVGTWETYSGAVSLTTDAVYSVEARNVRPQSGACAFAAGPSAMHTINIDRTPPTLTLDIPAANANGWHNTTATADWTCSDGGSGIDTTATACPIDTDYGDGTKLPGADVVVRDVAGNATTVSRPDINVDTTAPTLSVSVPAANSAGWNNTSVLADWTCQDNTGGSGIDTTATACPVDQLFSTDGIFTSQTVEVSDLAGNTASATRRELKIDQTGPSANVVVSPDATNGWNNTTVTAIYTCTEAGSGLATPCPTNETFTDEGAYPATTFTVTDNAGNTSPVRTRRAVNIDKTSPTVTVTLLDEDGNPTSPNGNGWFNHPVRVHFTCVDPTSGGVSSGVTAGDCPDDLPLGEGTHAADTVHVTDVAGNATDAAIPEIRIDLTAPELGINVSAVANDNGWNNTTVTVAFTCTDDSGGSGIATCPTDASYGDGSDVPATTYTVTDLAGNTSVGVGRRAIKVDTQAPTLAVDVSPDANAAGWNKTTVTVDWTCTDNAGGSGYNPATCPSDATYGDGTNLPADSLVLTDLAGNSSAPAPRRAIKVDTQAPTLTVDVSPDANAAGWNNSAVTEAWTCGDNSGGSGIDTTATPCPANQAYGQDDSPIAATTVTVTDVAGNSTSTPRRAITIDETAPSAAYTVAPPANAMGWNNTNVGVDYTCADTGGSELAATPACPADTTLTAEGDYPALSFHVTDVAGNDSPTATRPEVKIDKTAPTVTTDIVDGDGSTVVANAAGWFHQAVTVTYDCNDPTSGGVASGVATGSCPDDRLLTEGTHTAAPYDVGDNADNHTTGTVPPINIDTTAPITTVAGVSQSFYLAGAAPTPSCTTTDTLSGVATTATLTVTGPASGIGVFTATCAGAVDAAGNPGPSAQLVFTVGYGVAGFFQPIVDPAGANPALFKKGSTIPVKFALLDSTGARISDAAAQALVTANPCAVRLSWAATTAGGSGTGTATNSNPANTGNCFRYDPTADQFVFNLGTKDLATGGWRLIATVVTGGGTVAAHDVIVILR